MHELSGAGMTEREKIVEAMARGISRALCSHHAERIRVEGGFDVHAAVAFCADCCATRAVAALDAALPLVLPESDPALTVDLRIERWKVVRRKELRDGVPFKIEHDTGASYRNENDSEAQDG